MRRLYFDYALCPDGWKRNVSMTISEDGTITSIAPDVVSGGSERNKYVVPGMVNAHSHAFQRAMAGLAEYHGAGRDTFWTWREVMYRFATAFTPDDQRIVSAQLQIDLLKHGYTSLVEFHYLHNQPDGLPYADVAAMSVATIEAAVESGMGLTHVPTLYMQAGFDGAPLAPRQRRFDTSVESVAKIIAASERARGARPDIALGIGAHSLRAVPASALEDLLAFRKGMNIAPFHMHIAEQTGEVEDCLANCHQRPVEWLLEHASVDHNWTLVHSTHMNKVETTSLARTGATVALCPTTEGNLGDGIFPLAEYLGQGGRMAIGSDSHVCISPWEELRWLEYVQRLAHGERNIITGTNVSTATSILQHLSASATNVTGRSVGKLEVGARADLVVFDDTIPQFSGRNPEQIMDTIVFSCNDNPVRHVMVGGRWCIRDGHHRNEVIVTENYRRMLRRLTAGL